MREIAFKALVGSHNYGLQMEDSDKDFKIFTLPNFSDLYRNKMYSNSIIGIHQDLDFHDIRKIVELFWKSNINFLEVLFSKEITMSGIYEIDKILKDIFSKRNEIVTMNLPHLYSACHGMHLNKMSDLLKGTEGTKHLVDKFGYDTKNGLHAFRLMDFIERFADNKFLSFENALRYDNYFEREAMLDIKNGCYTLHQFREIIYIEYKNFIRYEEIYKSQSPKEEIKEYLDNQVYRIVKNYIEYEADMDEEMLDTSIK